MQDNDVTTSGGLGLSGIGIVVWIVFLVLKCCGVLPETFTWFWVWFPLWIVPATYLGLGLLAIVILAIIDVLD
jgi:hypothetical protein